MKIVSRVEELRELIRKTKQQNKTIGLVPTMGYLHEGHLTLMRTAKAKYDVVVASIFVNPLQFGPKEDYAVYPRDLERDSKLAAAAGVDLLFTPTVEDMYPRGLEHMLTYVHVNHITDKLCGATRPGHFQGVTTVVTKLFNIVKPDAAFFGQKDAQQVIVIKRMVADLSMDIEIVTVPIVRESDGLAMSSRNVFLTSGERNSALVLSRSLRLSCELLTAGERSADKIKEAMRRMIAAEPEVSIDYISICDTETLEELDLVTARTLVAIAVKVGKIRLIDNMVWGDNIAAHAI